MLTLDDRFFLLPRLKTINIALSEYSFTNLFLFRKKHDYKLVTIENELFIQGKTSDGKEILIITSFLDSKKMLQILEKGYTFYPVPEDWLEKFPKKCSFINEEADNDYLFKQEKIATYPGRDLSNKRNLVAQFERDYSVDVKPMTKELIDDANKVLEKWTDTSENSDDDREECKEALEFFEELSLNGFIYYFENNPIAFLLTEALTKDMHILHFAKALKDYKGVYPFIYQQFARSLPIHAWLNFEQDLGLPNLRQAKHSFHPDSYGKKFRVSLTT